MKPLSHPRSLALTLLLGSLGLVGLVGCGGALSFPDAVVSPQVQGPPVQGSVYGGHAPIVGAHVYLLQPGTSGYGSAATSLLGNNGATSAAGYALTADVNDPNVPVGSKYETSDSSGGFNLTGGYTCTVGQPVYLYSYGTSASTVTGTGTGTTNVNYSISKIVVSNANNNSDTATYTFTVSPAESLTVGQSVTISGFSGFNEFDIIEGSQTVLSGGLSTTTFSIKATNNYFFGNIGNGTYDTGDFGRNGEVTATVTNSTPTTQPELELATLGVCPSSGNFSTAGNGALSYVYMNEVSTVATAYTFQPFTVASNNNAWDIGSSGTTQALLGIANAAKTAAQLYDIQGHAQISTATSQGEGHLANTQTTSAAGALNAGNGVVPQATIDSLANILAACIDSAPTGGVLANQCVTLFNTATDNGETIAGGGTAPTDTATAAINIARYPAGNNSGTADANYASDLFHIPTSTVPYVPTLANAPNDWTIAINYPETAVGGYSSATNPNMGSAESIAVDGLGQIWITAQAGSGGPSISQWSPLGVQNANHQSSYIYGYVSIDGSNNAWTGNASSSSGIEEFAHDGTVSGTSPYGSGYNAAYTVITDNVGDAFFVANTSGTDVTRNCGGRREPACTNNYELFEYGPGGATIANSPFSISPGAITAGNNVAHGAIDASGDIWLTTEGVPDGNDNGDEYQIARVTPTGNAVFTSLSVGQQPEFPAIDNSGNAWIPIQATTGEIYKVTPTGGHTTLTSTSTGAELTSTFGAAVDGNGNVWVTNRCGNYGACGTTRGENTLVEINGTTNTAISPSTNYLPEAQYPATSSTLTPILSGPLNLAIDPSGNIWITQYTGNGVVEIVGAAAPVQTPLSVAASDNKLGAKP